MNVDPYLKTAGINIEKPKIMIILFRIAILINLLISGFVIYKVSSLVDFTLTYVIVIMLILWTLAFVGIVFLIWLLFLLGLEFKILRRTEDIEDHLPDYLLSTATNVRSGMDLEQALWTSIKPKYGVLSSEIEIVAKKVMGGMDLDEALFELKNKYKSDLLKRTIDILVEGKESGGQIASLLNDIGENVQQIQNIRKEIASSVTAYIIFIAFASVVAAPFLFGVSEQLITATTTITGGVDFSGVADSPIPTMGSSITISEFKIFAYLMMFTLSTFGALLNATLKTGKATKGIFAIPLYILISVIIFVASSSVLSGFLSSFV